MGDRVRVSVEALREVTDRVAAVRDLLAELDDLPLDEDALGDLRVAGATVEAQHGWLLQRAALQHCLGTLAGYVDAVARAAQQVDATVVTGRGQGG